MKEKQLQYYLVENFSDILYQGFNRILERNSLEELGFETCVDYCSYYGPVLEITDSEFFEAQNDQIEIHFQVTAELTLMLADYYLVPTSVTSQSFGVICKATPEKEFQDFQVCSIYPNSIPNVDSKKLSDQLIPIIYEENLEDEAQHILETYYPEALETPNPIDMRDFTSRLGLEVLQAAYGEASSVLGKIYFEDSDLKVRCGACQSALFHVPRGTIVLDPTNPHLRNEGSRRFTIMHECIHWIKHRHAMAYNRLFNQNGSYLVHHNWNSCKTSPFWFMEWQANALASRVLMPKEMFIQKYDEINWDNRCSEPFSNNLTVAAKTIREVAKFFNVSIQAARLRGIELGYDILFGVLNYVDGHYVPDHFTTHYQVPYHKTYCIGFDQFLRLLETDATLQNAVYSGDYIFVENHVCQNNKHWLEMTEDGVALNMWGRHAVDQCCLLFDKESNKLTDPENINLEFLDRETATNFVSLAGVSKDSNYESPDEQDHFLTEVRDVASISKSLPNNVPGALQKLIEWSGLSQAGIAANCLISEKTIQRILHDEDYEPPMETLVALCIGMKLPAVLSLRFIGIAGKNFKSTEKLTAYMTILTTCVNASIDYCNAMLVNLGVKPLTDAARTALKQTQPELFATLI